MEPTGSQEAFEEAREEYNETIKEFGNCILFAVFRGKMSEGISFNDAFARGVICVGLVSMIMASDFTTFCIRSCLPLRRFYSLYQASKTEVLRLRDLTTMSNGSSNREIACFQEMNGIRRRPTAHFHRPWVGAFATKATTVQLYCWILVTAMMDHPHSATKSFRSG